MTDEVTEATPDAYADAVDTYKIIDEIIDVDGYLLITIEVDNYKATVRNPNVATRAEVLETCARAAQEIRVNRAPKQQ